MNTTPDHVTCPACGGVYTAVRHERGGERWRFDADLPVLETRRSRWVVEHADGTECEVERPAGRQAGAAALAAMR